MQTPYTVGITGGSGSGKTFFIHKLAESFSAEELCLVSQDHYYKPIEMQVADERGVINFDLPESIDRDKFYDDLIRLKRGETLYKKEYTFNNPLVTPKIIEFKPAPILVIEGLFVQYFPEIERELDLKIFIEAKDHVKLSRRIKRDKDERGYGLDDVLYQYQYHVMPIYESLIDPLKHDADLVIPNNKHFAQALSIIVHGLRGQLKK
jgi:uridine kinase